MDLISYHRTPDIFVEEYLLKTPQAEMHYHHSYEMYYIVDGERQYFVGDRFFKIYKGDCLFVPKGMLHRTDGKGANRILSYFTDSFLSQYATSKALNVILPNEPFVFRASKADAPRLEALFRELLNEYNGYRNDKKKEFFLAQRLMTILVFVKSVQNVFSPQQFNNRHIESIVQYINDNYSDIINIEEISDYAKISKYYLCHLFSDNLGVPLITYLNTLKIRRACELLKEKKYSITEIAILCGFNSSQYFCKIFKIQKGMTPSQYIKGHME